MTFTILVVGKTKEGFWKEAEAEYLKRLKKFVNVEYLVVKPQETKDHSDARKVGAGKITKTLEGKEILSKISNDEFVVVLDSRGKQFSSEQLSKSLEDWQMNHPNITFVIGGTFGLSEDVLKRANLVWSLSQLTFTHETARVLALEQLYRAFTIAKNLPYHY